MSFLPAGYSSDEDDDEFGNFSFSGDQKSEKEIQQDLAADNYRKREELANTQKHRVYTAIIKGDLSQITEEIQHGFDVNSPVSTDWTPLFLSVMQGNYSVVKELLEKGADLTITRDGLTPLMAICTCQQKSTKAENVVAIIRLLVSHGIDVNAKDRKRRNAFMFACSQGFIQVVQILFPLINLEESDSQGWTGLFYAVQENNEEIVKFLVENGANVEHIDIRNNDIKYYATLNGFNSVLALLPKNDSDIRIDDFINKNYDYESEFALLEDGQRPDFKPDVCSLLFGMRCQNLITLFNKTNIGLLQFLTLNDDNLRQLGIPLSFQRNRILQGLHQFHMRPWNKRSIPFVAVDEVFTTDDIFVIMVNVVKHLTVLEATIKYLHRNLNMSATDKNRFAVKTLVMLKKVNLMKTTVQLLHAKAIKLDKKNQGPVDLITTNKNFGKNLLSKKVAIGLTTATVFYLFLKTISYSR